MIKPFSILDTRTKEWQDRKRWWIQTYNIKSELGREDTQSKSKFWDDEDTVSVFDATLCEKMYEWFVPNGGKVLDPFAGGSVRGIVATEMGFKYDGIDISQTQIDANRKQSDKPRWMGGDSYLLLNVLEGNTYDFVFTCPPYYDLEVYTDNANDLSNMSDGQFDERYISILQKSAEKLKNNRFFTVVVSEVREVSKTGDYKIGKYRGLVNKTISAMEEVGLHFYNDMVLFNSQHQAGRVVDTYFKRNRKVASVHQNVLVFVKGNPDLATEDIEWEGTYKCVVNGRQYKSFREAAISINPNWVEFFSSNYTLGIFLGLVFGKPIGIVLFTIIFVKMGICKLPSGSNWKQLISVSFLGGIGFTMSIFVTLLAFNDSNTIDNSKLMILISSLAAGILGILALFFATKTKSI
jgi:DNA modification methylase